MIDTRSLWRGLAVIVMLGGAATAHAQSRGTISGTATDGTGGVLPGVTIVITNVDTGGARTLTTDEGGRYVAPDLPPGPYSVKATLEGFTTVLRSGINLTVGQDAVVNLGLKIGQMSDEVTVVAEARTVETKSASTGGLISTAQIEGLPLNGRSFVELANLTPGVQLTQSGGQSTSTGFGAKLSVNGSRYTANLFTLDGTNLNDEYSQAGSASGNVLGVEAVREFQVLTNSFSAEFGHHTGGIINAATKSGTNALHGSLFEFHRDDSLDSKNYFDAEKPPFERNQFGFSLGGPIMRNKTFFFANYEGLHETSRRDPPLHRADRERPQRTGRRLNPPVAPFLSAAERRRVLRHDARRIPARRPTGDRRTLRDGPGRPSAHAVEPDLRALLVR